MEVGSLIGSSPSLEKTSSAQINGLNIKGSRGDAKSTPPAIFDYGYNCHDKFHYKIWSISCTLILIVFSFPVLVLVALTLFLSMDTPVIYRGKRLGKDRKPFTIYKFRTLKSEAEALTRSQVLPENSMMETRFGAALRDSRLDELPQLFNILKGDMDLFGPRPVRPEMADILTEQIPGYNLRFSVKPGLLGQAQILLPHDAPKRLRSSFNAKLIKRDANIRKELVTIFWVSFVMIRKLTSKIAAKYYSGSSSADLRLSGLAPRSALQNAYVNLAYANGAPSVSGKLLNMDSRAFIVLTDEKLAPGEVGLVLDIETPVLGKRKRATCKGYIKNSVETINGASNDRVGDNSSNEYRTLVEFTPNSPLNTYIVKKYFLDRSFIGS